MVAYRVGPVRAFEVPRSGGRTRRMAELSARDSATWQALAGRVAALLEARMDPRVIANRALVTDRGWRLLPAAPALRRARTAAAALASRMPLVATDVRCFYGSVRPEVLHDRLLAAGAAREDARLAAAMLEGWGSEGWPGLPVGPTGSAVLANAVLLPVDAAVAAGPFIRWVDDYVMPASFPLGRFDAALAEVGLERSGEKTAALGGRPWPLGGAAGYRASGA